MKTRRRQYGGAVTENRNMLNFYKPTQIRQRIGVQKPFDHLQELTINGESNIPINTISVSSASPVERESFSVNKPEHGVVEKVAAPKRIAMISRRNNQRIAKPINTTSERMKNNSKKASLVTVNAGKILVRNTGSRALLRKFRGRK